MSFRRVCDHPRFMTAVTQSEPKRLFNMHLSTLPSKLLKPLASSLLAAASVAALALTAHAETHVSLNLQLGPPPPVVVREAPPRPVVVERQYSSPGPGFVWVPGHNSWVHGAWVWFPGTWVRPPQPNTVYIEGRWDERSRNWIEPHWEMMAPPPPPAPAQVIIVDAPPPLRQEHRGHAPGPDYVWIDGYWAWHGHHHEWVAGRWDRPPHGHHTWVAPRWEHHGGSYVFIEGSWH